MYLYPMMKYLESKMLIFLLDIENITYTIDNRYVVVLINVRKKLNLIRIVFLVLIATCLY